MVIARLENRLTYLDGLKGLAAMIVYFSHYIYGFLPCLSTLCPEEPWYHVFSLTPLHFFYAGGFFLYLFFLLSGLFAAYKYLHHPSYKELLGSVVKRYIRLVFPVIVSIVIVYIFLHFHLFYNSLTKYKVPCCISDNFMFSPSILTVSKQALYDAFFWSPNPFTDPMPYNPVLWAIKYEFLGVLFVNFMMFIFGKNSYRIFIYTAFGILFISSYYSVFLFGLVLAELFFGSTKFRIQVRNPFIVILLLVAAIYLGSYPGSHLGELSKWTIYTWIYNISAEKKLIEMLVCTLGAFLLTLAVLSSAHLQKLFSTKIFLFLGSISYAIYVLHYIVEHSFSSYLFVTLPSSFSLVTSFIITFLWSIPVVILSAFVMHITVERWGILCAKYIDEKFQQPLFSWAIQYMKSFKLRK